MPPIPTAIEVSYIIRDLTWADGSMHHSIAIEQPPGLVSLSDAAIRNVAGGILLYFAGTKGEIFQIGNAQEPLPKSVLTQEGGLQVFLIGPGGETLDGQLLSL